MSTEDELRRCREILAELHDRHNELTVQLRLQTEAAQHSERENLRLSRLLQEANHDVSALRGRAARYQEVSALQREVGTLRECRDTWKRQAEALLLRLQTTQEWLERFQGLAAEKGLEVLRLEQEGKDSQSP